MMPKIKQPVEHLSADDDLFFEGEWYETMTSDHFWLEWRFLAFCRQWKDAAPNLNTSDLKVLEVGGGHGMLRQQLEDKFGWKVDLTDLNVGALQMSPPSRGRTLYYNILEKNVAYKEAYDVIFLYDVLEHIGATEEFVEALNWHMKPGGLIFINVPALNFFYSAFDKVLGHYRRYNKKLLIKHIAPFGFEVLDTRYWGITLIPFLAARWIYMLRLPHSKETQSSLARKGVTPPLKFMQQIFRGLMNLENWVAPTPPIGTSLLCAAKKISV